MASCAVGEAADLLLRERDVAGAAPGSTAAARARPSLGVDDEARRRPAVELDRVRAAAPRSPWRSIAASISDTRVRTAVEAAGARPAATASGRRARCVLVERQGGSRGRRERARRTAGCRSRRSRGRRARAPRRRPEPGDAEATPAPLRRLAHRGERGRAGRWRRSTAARRGRASGRRSRRRARRRPPRRRSPRAASTPRRVSICTHAAGALGPGPDRQPARAVAARARPGPAAAGRRPPAPARPTPRTARRRRRRRRRGSAANGAASGTRTYASRAAGLHADHGVLHVARAERAVLEVDPHDVEVAADELGDQRAGERQHRADARGHRVSASGFTRFGGHAPGEHVEHRVGGPARHLLDRALADAADVRRKDHVRQLEQPRRWRAARARRRRARRRAAARPRARRSARPRRPAGRAPC